ncbi:MAG: hypothetical protein KatS3mg087_2105 [Patescibacteria group bacterium]|nr:MAG: hypothetical protein KatS3mg087_2105 [Patescibacteria group bacterium]
MKNTTRIYRNGKANGESRYYELKLDDVLPYMNKVERLYDGSYKVSCPAHDDDEPSLHLSERNGKLLWRCHAGCDQEKVRRALLNLVGKYTPNKLSNNTKSEGNTMNTQQHPISLSNLAKAKGIDINKLREWHVHDSKYNNYPAVKIEYLDEQGNLVCSQYRLAINTNGSDNRFRFNNSPTLYGLWRLDKTKKTLCVTEGASDCWTLWQADINAIALPSASSRNLLNKLWNIVRNYNYEHVYIIPDNDGPGKELVTYIANNCPDDIIDRFEVVTLPNNTKDINELWIQSKDMNTFKSKLKELGKHNKPLKSFKTITQTDNTITVIDLATQTPKPQEWVIQNLIPGKFVTNFYGDSGTCKSLITLNLALSVITGNPFMGLKVNKTGPVLLLDFELSADEHTRRWWAVAKGAGLQNPPKGLYYITMKKTLFHSQTEIKQLIQEIKPALVIIDSVGKALGKPLDADASILFYQIAEDWDCAVVAVDHIAKQSADTPSENYREFGSVYKRHYARSAIQLEYKDSNNGTVAVILRHQKTNFGPLLPEIPVIIKFTNDKENNILSSVEFLHGENAISENTELYGDCGLILEHIKSTGQTGITIKELVQITQGAERTVRRHVKKLTQIGIVEEFGPQPKRYRVKQQNNPTELFSNNNQQHQQPSSPSRQNNKNHDGQKTSNTNKQSFGHPPTSPSQTSEINNQDSATLPHSAKPEWQNGKTDSATLPHSAKPEWQNGKTDSATFCHYGRIRIPENELKIGDFATLPQRFCHVAKNLKARYRDSAILPYLYKYGKMAEPIEEKEKLFSSSRLEENVVTEGKASSGLGGIGGLGVSVSPPASLPQPPAEDVSSSSRHNFYSGKDDVGIGTPPVTSVSGGGCDLLEPGVAFKLSLDLERFSNILRCVVEQHRGTNSNFSVGCLRHVEQLVFCLALSRGFPVVFLSDGRKISLNPGDFTNLALGLSDLDWLEIRDCLKKQVADLQNRV